MIYIGIIVILILLIFNINFLRKQLDVLLNFTRIKKLSNSMLDKSEEIKQRNIVIQQKMKDYEMDK